jgi:hypothetical protein
MHRVPLKWDLQTALLSPNSRSDFNSDTDVKSRWGLGARQREGLGAGSTNCTKTSS